MTIDDLRGAALPLNFGVCMNCAEVKDSKEFFSFGPKQTWFRGGYNPICDSCQRSKKWTREEYMWFNAKLRAWKKKIPFDILPEDIKVPEFCPVLGIPFKRSGWKKEDTPSLDEVIQGRGYVKGNVAVISFRANTIKNNATADELLRIADYIKRMDAEYREAHPELSEKELTPKSRRNTLPEPIAI